jgi:hypothetical protein
MEVRDWIDMTDDDVSMKYFKFCMEKILIAAVDADHHHHGNSNHHGNSKH